MLHKAGDPVPHEWFSKLENVKSIKFACDCSETVENGIRIIRKVGEGTHMVVIDREERKPAIVVTHPDIHFDGYFSA